MKLSDLFREEDGGLLFNPRLFGPVPYRGPANPDLKPEQLEELPLRARARVRTFDLSDPGQLKEYELVLQRIANSRSLRGHFEHHWDPALNACRVHAEWYDLERDADDAQRLGADDRGRP